MHRRSPCKRFAFARVLICLAVFGGCANAHPPLPPPQLNDDRILIVDSAQPTDLAALRQAYTAGKFVVVRNITERAFYEALGLMDGERVRPKPGDTLFEINPDDLPGPIVTYRGSMKREAIGAIRRINGKPHIVRFSGSHATSARNLKLMYDEAQMMGADATSSYTGGHLYDFSPYGINTWRWAAWREISRTNEHIWTIHSINSLTPGHALLPTYWDWELQQFQPRLRVSWAGQMLAISKPDTTLSGTSFSVNFGYQTAYSSWSWTVADLTVSKQENAPANDVNWYFNYKVGKHYAQTSNTQEPGIQATNTIGSFYWNQDFTITWNSLNWWETDVSSRGSNLFDATIILPDF